MNRKYVVIVHGLMIKNGTVASYGTEVTEGIEVDDAEGKVAEGYLLSKADFDKKISAESDIAEETEKHAVKKSEEAPKDKGLKKLI